MQSTENFWKARVFSPQSLFASVIGITARCEAIAVRSNVKLFSPSARAVFCGGLLTINPITLTISVGKTLLPPHSFSSQTAGERHHRHPSRRLRQCCFRVEQAVVCPSYETVIEAPPNHFQRSLTNLSRLAGVSEAGARCRNPERSEGSQNLAFSRREPAAEILTLSEVEGKDFQQDLLTPYSRILSCKSF